MNVLVERRDGPRIQLGAGQSALKRVDASAKGATVTFADAVYWTTPAASRTYGYAHSSQQVDIDIETVMISEVAP